MTRTSIAAAAALLALVGAACADTADTGAGSRSTTPPVDQDGTTLVLRVATEGGFTPVDYQLTNLPSFSLYDDGTILTPGPQMESTPSRRCPRFRLSRPTARLVAILAAEMDAGLDTARTLQT